MEKNNNNKESGLQKRKTIVYQQASLYIEREREQASNKVKEENRKDNVFWRLTLLRIETTKENIKNKLKENIGYAFRLFTYNKRENKGNGKQKRIYEYEYILEPKYIKG